MVAIQWEQAGYWWSVPQSLSNKNSKITWKATFFVFLPGVLLLLLWAVMACTVPVGSFHQHHTRSSSCWVSRVGACRRATGGENTHFHHRPPETCWVKHRETSATYAEGEWERKGGRGRGEERRKVSTWGKCKVVGGNDEMRRRRVLKRPRSLFFLLLFSIISRNAKKMPRCTAVLSPLSSSCFSHQQTEAIQTKTNKHVMWKGEWL